MNSFSGLIKCHECGKNFKTKRERGKIKYICSGYDRYGKDFCKRNAVKEEELLRLLEMKYDSQVASNKIRDLVSDVEVHSDRLIINYKDGSRTISGDRYLQI